MARKFLRSPQMVRVKWLQAAWLRKAMQLVVLLRKAALRAVNLLLVADNA
jgi:hypothetical protein